MRQRKYSAQMRLPLAVLTIFCSSNLVHAQLLKNLRESVTYHVASAGCTEVKLSDGWGMPDVLSKGPTQHLDDIDGIDSMQLRLLSGDASAIGVSVILRYSVSGNIPARNKYAFGLSLPSEVHELTDEEWGAAKPFRLYGDDRLLDERNRSQRSIATNSVGYGGKPWTSRGKYISLAMPSPNGRWLLLGSYSGKPPSFDPWGGYAVSSGHFYFERYDTASGDSQLLAHGQFHDISPSYFMQDNGWINDKFLLLSINPDKTTFVLCDASK